MNSESLERAAGSRGIATKTPGRAGGWHALPMPHIPSVGGTRFSTPATQGGKPGTVAFLRIGSPLAWPGCSFMCARVCVTPFNHQSLSLNERHASPEAAVQISIRNLELGIGNERGVCGETIGPCDLTNVPKGQTIVVCEETIFACEETTLENGEPGGESEPTIFESGKSEGGSG